jgi:hypothetical protein
MNERILRSDHTSSVSAMNFASLQAYFTFIIICSRVDGNVSRQSVRRDKTVNLGSIVFIALKNAGYSDRKR